MHRDNGVAIVYSHNGDANEASMPYRVMRISPAGGVSADSVMCVSCGGEDHVLFRKLPSTGRVFLASTSSATAPRSV